MMYRIILFALVLGMFVATVVAQQALPTPPADQVVRIATDLIQVDVTVTDKNGQVVQGLTGDDFEIYENGQRQPISNFSFVSRNASGTTAGDGKSSAGTTPVGSPLQMSKANVRNTIAIVVDDMNMSYASVYYARRALRRFVDTQMMPGDLVAVIRTGGGVGALQQFTSEKALLYAAIERIRWNPLGASGIDPLLSVGQTPTEITERMKVESDAIANGASEGKPVKTLIHENVSDKKMTEYDIMRMVNESQEGQFAHGTLSTIRYIIGGMAQLPGRKTMMLFTDGLTTGSDSNKGRASSVFQHLQEVVDVANRSAVVVYTFDTKGMKSMSIQASDNTYEIIDGHRSQKERARLEDFRNSQNGLAYFATQTGGKSLLNSNDLNGGIERALDEQAGYYLLGYLPDSETFDAAKRKFNKLEVKVKRPGLNVSYRSGFFNTETNAPVPQLTVERQIAGALMSPFSNNDIRLNINALFADDATDGTYIRSFLHIDAKSLTFTDDADGWKKSTFDVAAVTFGDNGMPIESKETKHTIRTKGATYAEILERGFVYVLIMPIKNHGVHQYRVAVRDADTGKMGSASQIVDIPNLSKRKLALSSLVVEGVTFATWQNIAAGKVGNNPGQMKVPSTLLYDTVLRQFKAGMVMRYGIEVYNAKAGSDAPRLETQARILQNNSVVVDGNLNKVDVSNQKDFQRVKVSGAIMLKDTLQPGDYVLQLTATDRSGRQVAMQLFPFEIVN